MTVSQLANKISQRFQPEYAFELSDGLRILDHDQEVEEYDQLFVAKRHPTNDRLFVTANNLIGIDIPPHVKSNFGA